MAASASSPSHDWGVMPSTGAASGPTRFGDRILAELAAEGVDVHARCGAVEGCASPSAAILVDDRGERLVCAYNDPALDPDASWLPLGALDECQAVLADVRWPEGARAGFDGRQTRRGLLTVFDGDIGPRDALNGARATCRLRRLFPTRSRPRHWDFAAGRRAYCGCEVGARRTWASRLAPMVSCGAMGPAGAGFRRRSWTAVDTLAAGDVWHGAFTLALAEGSDVAQGRPLRQRRGGDQVLKERRATRRAEPRGGGAAAR